ncbi:iron-containing alcohol dehydrogenase, partial [Pseudomonadota bacterium]
MKTDFFFQIDNRLHYGIGKSRELNALMDAEGWKDVTLLVDEGVAQHSDYYVEVKGIIEGAANSVTEIKLRGSEEPSYDYLDDIADQVRALDNVDAIIAIGGGSALDTAKAVAGLRTNPGPGINYRGFDQLTVPAVPSVCIPTTAGTGSEVTINAVFTDKSEMKKLGINGRYMNATHAVLDAKWLESCPDWVQVSAGMDAMVHTLESFMTTNRNPMTRAFNREAFVTLYKNLPALINAPDDLDAKQAILMGAYLAAAG